MSSALGNPKQKGSGVERMDCIVFRVLVPHLNNEQQVFSVENACDRHFKRKGLEAVLTSVYLCTQ